ncbi:MAG TPA: aryldialkylphosphatase [Acidimicrobiia bacterium]|nr:aryldialkylphosphatase [Acidimicrobiia bacterium]
MTVRTVLGDVDASSLGAVYMHEHLILDNALIANDYPHIHLPSVEEAVAEVTPCALEGVGCMVDAMPAAGGRRPGRLAEISERTGVAIIAMTGLHTPKYYIHHPWALTAEPDVLADLFVADIVEGIDEYDYTGPVIERTTVRAGMIKVATEGPELTDRERRALTAAADGASRTGVQILTHCEEGVGAMEQLSFLSELGFPLERVVVSHTDKVMDLGYHRDIMATGVFVEYDQALRRPPGKYNDTARVAAAMVREGFGDRIMFGTDGARRTLWSSLGGGPGLAWMRTGFIDALAAHGVSGAEIDTMFTTNPQRFLTMHEALA